MEINIEIRADEEGQCWHLRIDGHEWEQGLTAADVFRSVRLHIQSTMDCLIAEIAGPAEMEQR